MTDTVRHILIVTNCLVHDALIAGYVMVSDDLLLVSITVCDVLMAKFVTIYGGI